MDHPQQNQESQDVKPKRALGRGLSALLGGNSPAQEAATIPSVSTDHAPAETGELRQIEIGKIERNPHQPRKEFSKDTLKELADSIREHGVIQPIIVRETGRDDGAEFQLIAGERRWLASQHAGLAVIPCRVMDVIDKTACEFAFEENLKRHDLNDIEKALAFKDYIETFETSIEELAKQLSMSRSAVSNTLRLLDLPVPIRQAIQQGKLSAGHGRAMLSLPIDDQLKLYGQAVKEGWSVRKTEAASREMQAAAKDEQPATVPMTDGSKDDPADQTPSNHLKSLEGQLRDLIGAKVCIKQTGKDSGRIIIDFNNNSEFEGILRRLREKQAHAA